MSAASDVAELSGPLTEGRLIEPVCPLPVDLAGHGYVEEEFVAAGTARAYRANGPLGLDGAWTVSVADTAPFRTRIVVRRPKGGRRFNGTVVVEWLNVSGGVEAAPDWAYLHDEVLRSSHVYVAVSTQAFGVHGGRGLIETPGVVSHGGLVAAQPARYGALCHPGDRFAFDIFSQVGRALRWGPNRVVLGGHDPRCILAVGQSQSAFFLTTYVDAVHHGAEVYDGFLVHSRGGGAASLEGVPRRDVTAVPSMTEPATASAPSEDQAVPVGLRIRSDTAVPVLVFETETDLGPRLDFAPARQPDTDRVRTWEVAGTAHADAYLVGSFARALGCPFAVNDGPHHEVVLAALRALERWVTDGTPPPSAPPLRLASLSPPSLARDQFGNAIGGVRTPAVDVPVAALSGEAPVGASVLCSLFGSTTAFGPATLRRLYGSRRTYLGVYVKALDHAVAAGFLLEDDRPGLLARAERTPLPS